jgi:hypothetical protein
MSGAPGIGEVVRACWIPGAPTIHLFSNPDCTFDERFVRKLSCCGKARFAHGMVVAPVGQATCRLCLKLVRPREIWF